MVTERDPTTCLRKEKQAVRVNGPPVPAPPSGGTGGGEKERLGVSGADGFSW